MAKVITNKTRQPLRVPLRGGKKLHLGPRQSGQLSVHDAEHPPLLKLVEEGKVELVDDSGNEAIPLPGRRGTSPF